MMRGPGIGVLPWLTRAYFGCFVENAGIVRLEVRTITWVILFGQGHTSSCLANTTYIG